MSRMLPLSIMIAIAVGLAAESGLLPMRWMYVAKPLCMALMIAHAWRRGHDTPAVRRFVLSGLTFSLIGDVFLMWPSGGFLPGLAAFLLAHLAYIAAFSTRSRFFARWVPFAAYAMVACGILVTLWPDLSHGLRVPVLLYVLCMSTMASQAAVVWLCARGTGDEAIARLGVIGGGLFVVAELLLAANRTAGPLPLVPLLVLLSYWGAQWFIASSLRERAGPTSP